MRNKLLLEFVFPLHAFYRLSIHMCAALRLLMLILNQKSLTCRFVMKMSYIYQLDEKVFFFFQSVYQPRLIFCADWSHEEVGNRLSLHLSISDVNNKCYTISYIFLHIDRSFTMDVNINQGLVFVWYNRW